MADDSDDFVRVPLAEWESVIEHLERFGQRGDVAVEDDRVRVESGGARLVVTRDGRVETGMPLHDFESGGIDALYVDHDGGRVQVRGADAAGGGGMEYEFRRP
jgi:hypothetical protein